jgi:hypothetical protein
VRVLKFLRHHSLPVPGYVIETRQGKAIRVDNGEEIYIAYFDHGGRVDVTSDDWPKEVDAVWAEYAAKQLLRETT